jgi:hypothetical protein
MLIFDDSDRCFQIMIEIDLNMQRLISLLDSIVNFESITALNLRS